MAKVLPSDHQTGYRLSSRPHSLARAALAAGLLLALLTSLSGCAVTKVVTIPVKVAAKTVETAVDVVD